MIVIMRGLRPLVSLSALIIGLQSSVGAQPYPLVAPVPFPDVGLAIPQPEGFEKANSFYGFQHPSIQSSILLTTLPGPFLEVTEGLNAATFATKGITLLSKQSIELGERSGLLLHVLQPAYGQDFLKWIVIFGDEERTHMVTATFPKTQANRLGKHLKEVCLDVTLIDATDGSASKLPFTIQPTTGLTEIKEISSVGKVMAFSKGGNIPTPNPYDPIFIVAPSLGNVPVIDRRSFALKRLRSTAQTDIDTITSITEITVDDLEGFEIVARGTDQKSNTPMMVYQVILFRGEGGLCLNEWPCR